MTEYMFGDFQITEGYLIKKQNDRNDSPKEFC